jgi:hypothetical protein
MYNQLWHFQGDERIQNEPVLWKHNQVRKEKTEHKASPTGSYLSMDRNADVIKHQIRSENAYEVRI